MLCTDVRMDILAIPEHMVVPVRESTAAVTLTCLTQQAIIGLLENALGVTTPTQVDIATNAFRGITRMQHNKSAKVS